MRRTINEIRKELEQAEVAERNRINKEHVKGCEESLDKCPDCKHNHAYHRSLLRGGGWTPSCEMCGLSPEHPYRAFAEPVCLKFGPSFDDQVSRDLCGDCAKRVVQIFKDTK